jgi:hypothetical protein
MATYTENCYTDDGRTLLGTLTEEIEGAEIAVKDTLAYKTYGESYVFIICRGRAQMARWLLGESINLNSIQNNDFVMNFYFARRIQISDFAWTDNDDEKIKAGQPVSNLTAAAMNDLYQKLVAMKTLTGVRADAVPTITSGDTITASIVSQAFSGIAGGLTYVDEDARQAMYDGLRYNSLTKGAPIYARILLNMKVGVNKLIQEMRPL